MFNRLALDGGFYVPADDSGRALFLLRAAQQRHAADAQLTAHFSIKACAHR